MSTIEFFDLETDGLNHDATRVWCASVCALDQDEPDLYTEDRMDEVVERLAAADLVVGHNINAFDCPCLSKLYGATFKKQLDTLVVARLMYPDRHESPVGGNSLAEWGVFLKFPKMEFDDWSCYSPLMGKYCQQDVRLCKEIYKYERARWADWKESIQLEHQVSEIISRMCWNGVTIYPDKAQHLYTIANAAREPIMQRLREAFPARIETMKTPEYYIVDGWNKQFPTKGEARSWAKMKGLKNPEVIDGPLRTKEHPFNPNAGQQIAERLIEKYNWKPKVFTDSGAVCTDYDVLSRLADKYPEAQWIIDWKMAENRANTALKWIECIHPETGRLHHSVTTNGAVTGRMSHSDPNVNVPKVKKGKDKQILYGFDGDFGYECRSCFGPRPGWWQVGTDASGLELRMLAHYMAEWDDGEYADTLLNGDIHDFNQKAAGLPTRDDAKTFIYAFLYGAGDGKIGKIIKGTSDDGAALKAKFLKSLPALNNLKKWIAKQVGKGFVVGLDGRKVPLRSEHSALNTVLQGGGALVMKKALVIRDKTIRSEYEYGTDYADILNVHDEFQSEARKKSIAERIGIFSVDGIVKAGEYFELRCPLNGEYKVGKNWAECH